MFKKKITWIIIAILIVAGSVIYFQTREKKIEYTTEESKRGELVRTVSATGTFQSTKEAELGFQVGGRVEKLNVKAGDKVRKGQLLGYLDQAEYLETVRQYRSDLLIQEKDLLLKRRDWDTYKPEEREAAKELVEKYRSLLNGTKVDLRKTLIYSPMDGMVASVDIKEGEIATAGAKVIMVMKEGDWEIEADVAESDIAEVALGQKVSLTFDALSSEDIFGGEVIQIDPASTVIQEVVYYKIKIRLEKIDGRLKRGMSADADIETAKKDSVILIPARAVKEENGQKYVEVLKEDNQVEKQRVEIGTSGDGGLVEVKSGISEGQRVITFTKE
ncbi:MAG: efflux RND transporter periplasmic adaptor subunit [Patescibacteria group bacterium]